MLAEVFLQIIEVLLSRQVSFSPYKHVTLKCQDKADENAVQNLS